MSTNNSKGFQAQMICAAGFSNPRTLITNDPKTARSFIESELENGTEVIFKFVSAVRSIVRIVGAADLDRLGQLRVCPVQFQERVIGVDHRVHVVGDEVFATRIETTGIDYRYADREEDGGSDLSVGELPPDVAQRCMRLAGEIGISFAGIDLRICPDGRVVCFEVNPSPAFSYYEAHTGQPIANAVARKLARI